MKAMRRSASWLLVLTLILTLLPSTVVRAEVKELSAKIAEVQKYGNVILDLKPTVMLEAGYEAGDILSVEIGENKLEMPFCTSYSDVDTGSLLFRHSAKDDMLLIAINLGDFSKKYNAKIGDSLTVSLKEKKGYLSEYLLRQLKRTNNRGDYATDSIFANFRNIITGDLNKGVLYRSSSPINNELERAAYSDRLAKAVGIKTVVNLADSKEEIEGYIAKEDFNSPYYKSLLDKKSVTYLDMGIDIGSEAFSKKLAKGLKFMTKKKGPYLVHCTEGKDRAGFASAVLAAFMGADMDEIVRDYMVTYENYYHVIRGSEQYKKIADANIVASMTTAVFGLEKGADISKIDVAKATEKYFRKIGLTKKEIKKLRSNLSGTGKFRKPNVKGKVVEVEKYGHGSTNVKIADLEKKGFRYGDRVTVIFDNGFVLEAPYVDGYFVDFGDPLVRAYPGQETIGLCINYGKLNKVVRFGEGEGFLLMRNQKAGYLEEYEARKLERTYDRKDYESDEVYANFRNIKFGKIAEGVLYRSSSPINNELKRAKFADKLIEGVKIKTVVNLADRADKIEKYMLAEDFASPYYKKLYENGNVILLNLGLAFHSQEFRAGIAKGAKFISEKEAPYHVHCTEGKDRAGYMSVFLEALMGATKEEIIEDYMKSYMNYFHVEKDSKKYRIITKDVIKMMESIAGGTELTTETLTKGAEKLLTENGFTKEQVETLKTKLSTPLK